MAVAVDMATDVDFDLDVVVDLFMVVGTMAYREEEADLATEEEEAQGVEVATSHLIHHQW